MTYGVNVLTLNFQQLSGGNPYNGCWMCILEISHAEKGSVKFTKSLYLFGQDDFLVNFTRSSVKSTDLLSILPNSQ